MASSSDKAATKHLRVCRVLVAVFVASGATSLIYEITWAQQLHLVFGTSQLAICTVLAAFMAGLGLGGFLAARWAGRVTRPLIVFGLLEAAIGLYALIFPWLVELVIPINLEIWRVLNPDPVTYGALRALLLGVLLLFPTTCMGATLPLLVRFFKARDEVAGFQVGRLYGANTIGAVLGTALSGFLLLPWLGLAHTTWSTAFVSGLIALAALSLARMSSPTPLATPMSEAEVKPLEWGLLLIAGLAGFSALLYEVAWFRLMVLMLGGSTYAFSIMLLSFLLGLGIGSWTGGASADRNMAKGGVPRVLVGLAGLQVGVAVASWAAMYAYNDLPFAFVWLFFELGHDGVWLQVSNLLLALGIMLPPALLMGASFPYMVRAASHTTAEMSRPVGLLYGVNTVGALAGTVFGVLILLPNLHVSGTVLVAVSVNVLAALAAGTVALAAKDALRGARVAALTVAAVMAIGFFHWLKPPWDPLLMTSGTYKYAGDIDGPTRQAVLDYVVTPYRLLYYAEGLSSVVTVAADLGSDNIWLANNGKVDASSHVDLEAQVLLGHLPFVFRPDAKRVLVIGLGSAITAGSVTLHPGVERIDVVEIEPEIFTASHYFDAFNHQPLDDPRVRTHVNDGRNHLALSADASYDLVSSEPSNPWLSGASNLFTREFFEMGRRKLRPGGVWAQWVQAYGMNPEDLKSLFATFADTYTHVRLFRVDASDLIMVGSEAPLPIDTAALGKIFNHGTALTDDLARIQILRPEHILGRYCCGQGTLRALAGEIERNTDDNMRIEYSAPLHLHEPTEEANSRLLARVAELPLTEVKDTDGLLVLAGAYAAWDPTWRRALATLRFAHTKNPDSTEVEQLYADYLVEARAFAVRNQQ